jgi:hypothetical protein
MNNRTSDLRDSEKDTRAMEEQPTTMDLPEVKDIPGQEHVKVPRMKEMADTTISSADEEGDDILGTDDELEDAELDNLDDEADDADVDDVERALLERSSESMSTDDDQRILQARVDSTDDDGELLNEETEEDEIAGDALDVPGSAADDDDEAIGEEDEENNNYSLGGDEKEDRNEQLND